VTDEVIHRLKDAERAYTERLNSLTGSQWRRLRSALERVEHGPSVGTRADDHQLEDGSRVLSVSSLSDEASELMQTLDHLGFHMPFDWLEWEDGRLAADRAGLLDQVSPAQAAMVIFIIWRTDRHSDGALLEALEAGVIQSAVARMLSVQDDSSAT
jgi:hypothetical protein